MRIVEKGGIQLQRLIQRLPDSDQANAQCGRCLEAKLLGYDHLQACPCYHVLGEDPVCGLRGIAAVDDAEHAVPDAEGLRHRRGRWLL